MPAGQHLSAPAGPPPDGYPRYAGPPPNAAHDPGLGPQPPDPSAYPYPSGYAYPPPYPYGGYPGVAPGARRPGTLTASAVLAYVDAGLLIIAAMILFSGASLVAGIDNSEDALDLSSVTAELTVAGFLNLIAAGLLVTGGVLVTTRRPGGPATYAVAALVVLAESVYWLARWGTRVDDVSGVAFYAVLFGGLAIVGLCLSLTNAARAWLGER